MQATQLALHVLLQNAPDDMRAEVRRSIESAVETRRGLAAGASAAHREEVQAMVDGMEQAAKVLMP